MNLIFNWQSTEKSTPQRLSSIIFQRKTDIFSFYQKHDIVTVRRDTRTIFVLQLLDSSSDEFEMDGPAQFLATPSRTQDGSQWLTVA